MAAVAEPYNAFDRRLLLVAWAGAVAFGYQARALRGGPAWQTNAALMGTVLLAMLCFCGLQALSPLALPAVLLGRVFDGRTER